MSRRTDPVETLQLNDSEFASTTDKKTDVSIAIHSTETADKPTTAPRPRSSAEGSGKLAHYDGLRGIAALWVFFIHFLPSFANDVLMFLQGYQKWKASVPLFFILSGRVIPVSLMRSGKIDKLVSAVVRRPFRLLVPIWAIMTMDWFFWGQYKVESVWDILFTPMWFMFDEGPLPKHVTGVVWTLNHEYIGSNIVFFTLFITMQFPKLPRIRYTIMLFLFLWLQATHQWGTHFVAGFFIADLAHYGYVAQYRKWRWSMIVTSIMFFASMAFSFRFSFWKVPDTIDDAIRSVQVHNGKVGVGNKFWEENFVVFVFSFAAMFAIETSDWLQRFFALPVFIFLGKISFTLYLFHHYWMRMVSDSYKKYMLAVVKDKALANFLIIVPMTLGVMYVSNVLAVVVDEPSVSFGRWLERVMMHEEWTLNKVFEWCKSAPMGIMKWTLKTFCEMLHRASLGYIPNYAKKYDIDDIANKINMTTIASNAKTFFDTYFPVVMTNNANTKNNGEFQPVPTTTFDMEIDANVRDVASAAEP